MSEFDSLPEGEDGEEQLIEQLLERYDEASALGLPAVLPRVEGLPPERVRELETLARRIDLVNQAARLQAAATGFGSVDRDSVGRANADSAAVAQNDPFAGEMIGRFRVLRELGRGGYGIVFLAFDSGIGRLVAIKLPRPEVLVTPELRSRFLREAQAAGRIDHPHVMPVHEAAEDGGMCYLVTPFCRGLSLAEWFVEHGPVPAHDVAQLGASLADALACAHQAGVLHRDIKPANILLDLSATEVTTDREQLKQRRLATFVPKLTDFGLAKLLQSGELETRTGALVGTPTYMAPEQATGRYADVRTDVYSLGVVMYELLTGQSPADASTSVGQGVLRAEESLVPPRKLQPATPRDLEAVILKCLEPAPAERYPAAAALAEDLRRFLNGMPTVARPAGLARKAWKAARRRPALAASIILSAVLAVALAASEQWHADQLRLTESALNNGQYAHDMLAAAEARRRGAIDEVDSLLAKYAPGQTATEVRGFEWYWLRNAVRERERAIRTGHGEVYGVTFAPGGESVYTGGKDGVIRLWDVRQGTLLREMPGHSACVNQLAFSPDGATLASISCDGTVRLWNPATGEQTRLLVESKRELTTLAFAHHHPWLAVDTHQGVVQVWDVSTGVQIAELGTFQENVHADALAFRADDGLLAGTTGVGPATVWETRGWQPVRHHDFFATALAFVGPQQELVIGANNDLILWNAESGTQTLSLGGEHAMIRGVAGMHQRNIAFLGGSDGFVRGLDLHGQGRHVLPTSERSVQGLEVSADDRHLAVAGYDGWLRVWDLERDQIPLQTSEDAHFHSAALSRNGRWAAINDSLGQTRLYDLNTHEQVAEQSGFEALRFSPAGKILVARRAADKKLVLLRCPTLQPLEIMTDVTSAVAISISADDRVVAALDPQPMVHLFDIEREQPLARIPLQTKETPSGLRIALSGDGSRLLWMTYGQAIERAIDTTTGQPAPVPEDLSFLDAALVFPGDANASPDGRQMLSLRSDLVTWNLHDTLTGTVRGQARHSDGYTQTGVWTADGRRILVLTRAGNIVVLDAETGDRLCKLDSSLDPVRSQLVLGADDEHVMAFTADGESPRGNLSMWRAPRGENAFTAPAHN